MPTASDQAKKDARARGGRVREDDLNDSEIRAPELTEGAVAQNR